MNGAQDTPCSGAVDIAPTVDYDFDGQAGATCLRHDCPFFRGHMFDPSQPLPAGKLPLPFLEKLLTRFAPNDPRIIVGPRAGEDAAVFDLGDRCLVAKTDPITFATSEIGWYAVNVNANDVAVMGARPRWFLATVLLPAGKATGEMAESIFRQIYEACAALGVSLAGGHTEITVDLNRPLVSGTMLGEVAPDRMLMTAGARPGDRVLLVKSAPIEGTALIALEREALLRERGYDAAFICRCQRFLHEPGISVVAPALIAADADGVHAMHDPTEGGVMTGLLEMARGAGVGMNVDLDAIPIAPEGAVLCREFGLDPLGTIASGAVLVSVAEAGAQPLIEKLTSGGYPAATVGWVTEPDAGLVAQRNGERVEWPMFAADEITKIFA
jgi:hydrogenase maturation factor